MASSDYTSKDIQRFWSKVKIGDPDECWEWQGGLTLGYGYLKIKNKKYRAHRIAWELTQMVIPDGLFICHKCDNPSCCNPNHLFLGTQQDNMDDMVKKGRQRPIRVNGKPMYEQAETCIVHDANGNVPRGNNKLTHEQVLDIRSRYGTYLNPNLRISYSYLAAEYGVTSSTIQNIVKLRTWK